MGRKWWADRIILIIACVVAIFAVYFMMYGFIDIAVAIVAAMLSLCLAQSFWSSDNVCKYLFGPQVRLEPYNSKLSAITMSIYSCFCVLLLLCGEYIVAVGVVAGWFIQAVYLMLSEYAKRKGEKS